MDTLGNFLLFGSMVWFWILVGVEFLCLSFFVYEERGGSAFISVLTFSVLCVFAGSFSDGLEFSQWLTINPGKILILTVIYFLIGCGVSVLLWFLYVLERKHDYLAALNRARVWERDLTNVKISDYKPDVAQYGSKVMLWIGYWPIALLLAVLRGPFVHIARYFFDMISGTLQAISEKSFQNYSHEEAARLEEKMLRGKEGEEANGSRNS